MRKHCVTRHGQHGGNSISTMHRDSSLSSTGVQNQERCRSEIHRRKDKRLEHQLEHFLALSQGGERCLAEENRMLFGSHSEFAVERMVQNLHPPKQVWIANINLN